MLMPALMSSGGGFCARERRAGALSVLISILSELRTGVVN